jgi:hypothetical protein
MGPPYLFLETIPLATHEVNLCFEPMDRIGYYPVGDWTQSLSQVIFDLLSGDNENPFNPVHICINAYIPSAKRSIFTTLLELTLSKIRENIHTIAHPCACAPLCEAQSFSKGKGRI